MPLLGSQGEITKEAYFLLGIHDMGLLPVLSDSIGCLLISDSWHCHVVQNTNITTWWGISMLSLKCCVCMLGMLCKLANVPALHYSYC